MDGWWHPPFQGLLLALLAHLVGHASAATERLPIHLQAGVKLSDLPLVNIFVLPIVFDVLQRNGLVAPQLILTLRTNSIVQFDQVKPLAEVEQGRGLQLLLLLLLHVVLLIAVVPVFSGRLENVVSLGVDLVVAGDGDLVLVFFLLIAVVSVDGGAIVLLLLEFLPGLLLGLFLAFSLFGLQLLFLFTLQLLDEKVDIVQAHFLLELKVYLLLERL